MTTINYEAWVVLDFREFYSEILGVRENWKERENKIDKVVTFALESDEYDVLPQSSGRPNIESWILRKISRNFLL